ncbi:oxidoreductase [Haladaptatus caseinilyticus]|uniref:oxidoreductase n=1 Tax=Haladaptatus caseinilyticus TaxID=2993314 RepID=UPI00224B06FF|nr:FAD-dependent oxidoreductase [Haladaptatus caseinilyticus]
MTNDPTDAAILRDDDPNNYRYERLFEPTSIGTVELRNRLMMTGHTTNYARGSEITDSLIDYYVERGEGGIGLIVMAYLANHPSSMSSSAIRGWDDDIVPQLRRLTDAVHETGARIICQNLHYGRQMTSLLSEQPVLSSSDIPGPVNREMPRQMDQAEIGELVESYATTANVIQRGGFDGVEIHSGYGGYLLSQFLSPYSNERTDEYGGSVENRLRIVYETLDAVRDEVGEDFVVGLQVNATDDAPHGMGIEGYEEVARRLAATEQVDYLVVKAGTYQKQDYIVPDMQRDHALLAPLAKRIRTVVHEENPTMTVATTGRITDPRHADRILQEGAADIVSMTRGHIADPYVARKAQEGRLDELIECMGCNQGCIQRIYEGASCRCVLNPATGFEADLGVGSLTKTTESKDVLVVGGGPAGMKAAEVAARIGHRVTLCERDGTLGGQVRFAKEIPNKAEFEKPVLWLREALDREDVTVRTGVEVTAEYVERESPDAVIVATGSSQPTFPRGYHGIGIREEDIPGWEDARVLTSTQVLSEALRSENGPSYVDPGNHVLVIDDGEHHWKGIGTAKFLAEEGRTVHFAQPGGDPGGDLTGPTKAKLHRDLFSMDTPVEIHTFTTVDRVNWPTVMLKKRGKPAEIPDLESIVLAGFHRSEDVLENELSGVVPEVHVVGDAVAARTIKEAIHEGERVAREL